MWTLLAAFQADTRGSAALDWVALGGVVLVLGAMLQVTFDQLQIDALGERIFTPVETLQTLPDPLRDPSPATRLLVGAN